MAVTKLTEAIDLFRSDAAALFTEAHNKLATNLSEADKKKYQIQLQAALSQLTNSEVLSAAQKEREGYAQVVDLMTTTASTSKTLCASLTGITLTAGNAQLTDQLRIVEALTKALAVLAQLSPAAVFDKKGNA